MSFNLAFDARATGGRRRTMAHTMEYCCVILAGIGVCGPVRYMVNHYNVEFKRIQSKLANSDM